MVILQKTILFFYKDITSFLQTILKKTTVQPFAGILAQVHPFLPCKTYALATKLGWDHRLKDRLNSVFVDECYQDCWRKFGHGLAYKSFCLVYKISSRVMLSKIVSNTKDTGRNLHVLFSTDSVTPVYLSHSLLSLFLHFINCTESHYIHIAKEVENSPLTICITERIVLFNWVWASLVNWACPGDHKSLYLSTELWISLFNFILKYNKNEGIIVRSHWVGTDQLFQKWNFRNVPLTHDRMKWSCVALLLLH